MRSIANSNPILLSCAATLGRGKFLLRGGGFMYSLVMVDDEEVVLENIANSFDWESMGFRLAATFTDAASALDYFNRNAADLLITDVRMPSMSGLELTQAVTEKKAGTLVAVLTAHKDFEYARISIGLGVFSYLLKPVTYRDIQELCQKAKNALDKRAYSAETVFQEPIPFAYQKAISDYMSKKEPDIKKLVDLFGGLSVDLTKSPAVVVEIVLDDLENFLTNAWPYEKDRLYSAIGQLAVSDGMILVPLSSAFDKLRFLAISKAPNEESFSETISGFIIALTQNCLEMLNLVIIVKFGPISAGMNELLRNETYIARSGAESDALFRLLQEGKTEQALEKAAALLTEAAYDPDYLNFFTLGLYERLSVCVPFEDFANYAIYPAGISFPPRPDKKNMPADIGVMAKYLPITVKNAAAYLKGDKRTDDAMIASAKTYVEKHYMESLTLAEIASHVYLSEYYFCRYFKKKTGINFVDYLNKIRIERACDMFTTTNMRTADVCAKVGYISLNYFHKKFKALTGLTPKEYRSVAAASKTAVE